MYWQVYLHKTGIVAERVLVKIIERARELIIKGEDVPCSATLKVFLDNEVNENNFAESIEAFSRLDDYDVMSAVKDWCYHEDKILSYLCNSIVNRRLPKIEMRNEEFEKSEIFKIKEKVKESLNLNDMEVEYLVYHGTVSNKAYNPEAEQINILYKNGEQKDIVKASDSASIQALSLTVRKYFLCYPKKLR